MELGVPSTSEGKAKDEVKRVCSEPWQPFERTVARLLSVLLPPRPLRLVPGIAEVKQKRAQLQAEESVVPSVKVSSSTKYHGCLLHSAVLAPVAMICNLS